MRGLANRHFRALRCVSAMPPKRLPVVQARSKNLMASSYLCQLNITLQANLLKLWNTFLFESVIEIFGYRIGVRAETRPSTGGAARCLRRTQVSIRSRRDVANWLALSSLPGSRRRCDPIRHLCEPIVFVVSVSSNFSRNPGIIICVRDISHASPYKILPKSLHSPISVSDPHLKKPPNLIPALIQARTVPTDHSSRTCLGDCPHAPSQLTFDGVSPQDLAL